MSLAIDSRPEKVVNGITSRWNAGNLPLQYEVSNTKWPTNTDDLTDSISTVSDSNGYARLNLGTTNETYTAKLWVKVTGSTGYDGVHRVRAATVSTITIDFPYEGSETGTVQIYYQNYTTIIRVYAGLDPAHDHAALKPMELIGTIEQRPDTDNITYVDVKDYVKSKLNTTLNPELASWPNDINIWCDFYVSVAERYDAISGNEVVSFTSSYTSDTVYCKSVHSALQFGDANGGNMGEYLASSSPYKEALAQWMTTFDRPKIIDYNRFYLSIIVESPRDLVLLLQELDRNGDLINYDFISVADEDYGVYRIEITYLFDEDATQASVQLFSGVYTEMSEELFVDVDVACADVTLPPEALSVEVLTRSSVFGEFTDTSGGVATHQVYYSLLPDSDFTLVETLDAGVTTFTQTGLTAGLTYYYKVRAIENGVASVFTSTVSVLIDGLFINVTTSNTSGGSSTSTQFKIPTVSTGTYNFVVSWGDGTSSTITTWNDGALTHTYSIAGSYEVDIVGTITGWQFNNSLDRLKITEIERWGDLALTSLAGAFYGCANMLITATDTLNTSGTTTFADLFRGCTALTTVPSIGTWDTNQVTTMSSTFQSCTNFNSSVNGWEVSAVTNFNGTFSGCTNFNQSLNSWNVSAATSMSSMFENCTNFNGNITSWVTSSLTNMSTMFRSCAAFNQDIGSWDVADVTNLSNTFQSCVAFNQSLNSWNVAKVTNMNDTFNGCTVFNGNITGWTTTVLNTMIRTFNACPAFNRDISGWDVADVTNFTQTFAGCTIFNQSLNSWSTGLATSMAGMFQNCTAYNQASNSWNTASVTAFNSMFENCVAFNSNITSWNTGAGTTMATMFRGCTVFNQAITGWNTGNVTTMANMFENAPAFNQAIGVWSVPKVTTFASMFVGATAFNQDLGAWDVTITPRASLTMTNMLNTCGMNTANYDSTLVGWHAQGPIASVALGASGRTYTAAGAGGTARAALVAAPYNWTITGDSGV